MSEDTVVPFENVKADQKASKNWGDPSVAFADLGRTSTDTEITECVVKHVTALVDLHKVNNYEIVLLIDNHDNIISWHADRIYQAASAKPGEKDILLVIDSNGGRVEPAYLISKTCKRLSRQKFIAAVPRRAKSAATLIALGADEIHMGLMSELGPIDPQFGGFPALGMKNALSVLAELSCKHPGAAEMLSKYLTQKLNLDLLGYCDRVAESATQYAERLLEGKKLPAGKTAQSLSDHFVNHYKDHGFVIDADESEKLLGKMIVKQSTPEYRFSNALYQSLDNLSFYMKFVLDKRFDYVGSLSDSFRIYPVPK